ncbi:tRNA uridine-5-carboxymethylaminomethyl(34) synthesis GTPase MnmE [Sulfoacidibacillus thermotolerans]|uniref:tRNA modification GTPase MnmE n=1 Tax=Sulfoacidibacillus thermotolerans TaxID=1765684 RepID=A0A2U3D6A6_SULT2|nr:tRNA uridine-5-carboxymethylaminomethyl(34) synthesis GTPase MnmE [Sulfoacidibacillus thermotolerans]PWI56812.1 tRNA uridine-5-carboxymethylaminomethyl(34) synthesis GTPase MnmE [Sulfoacidibacillus thermotolerans]
MDSQDTIAAIATALGEASIAVIRVSGDHALDIVDRVFSGKQSLQHVDSHTVHYGHIVSFHDHTPLDEVLVTVMRSPRSYTTEDVVEISTHGGTQTVQAVLLELLRAGARLASPGEFTKRAFLGGRIDLSQAEGVMELIGAHTAAARQAALKQVEGSLSFRVKELRERLLQLMAHVEVTIDYPEHDEEEATTERVFEGCTSVLEDVSQMLETADQGRILRDGIQTAIIGRPNVGKSSLLNLLVRKERAIVTDIPGTTRDVLEEFIQVEGVPFHILDTAGIRETSDVVEKIGVDRSRKAMAEADLLLLVIDSSRKLSEEDERLLELSQKQSTIVILSKSDLDRVVSVEDVKQRAPDSICVPFSVKDPRLLQDLEHAMVDKISRGQMKPRDATFIANARHVRLLEQTKELLEQVLHSANEGQTLDLVAVDLYQAWVTLGEIIGETPREDLLDQIFTQFCLGK